MNATEDIDDKRALDFFSRAMSESRRSVLNQWFLQTVSFTQNPIIMRLLFPK